MYSSGPGFTHVITGDADGVPLRHIIMAVLEQVHDQPHGGPRRVGIGAPGSVFLENVVLHGTTDLFHGHTLLAGRNYIEAEQHGGSGVDGHGGADFVHGNLVKQGLHVLQAADRHADLAHFAIGQQMIRVVPNLGWQVECYR